MAAVMLDALIARNPATGAELGRVPATPTERVAEVVARAREAQGRWGETDAGASAERCSSGGGASCAARPTAWADLIRGGGRQAARRGDGATMVIDARRDPLDGPARRTGRWPTSGSGRAGSGGCSSRRPGSDTGRSAWSG